MKPDTIAPTRKGRFADVDDWRQQYKQKLVCAEEAVQPIRSGDVIAIPGGACVPHKYVQALAEVAKAKHLTDIEIVNGLLPAEDMAFTRPEYRENFSFVSHFYNYDRQMEKNGVRVSYIPNHINQSGLVVAGRKPRIIAVGCSAPDENGWMSRTCWAQHIERPCYEDSSCEIVVASIHKDLPYPNSSGKHHINLHVSEVDFIIEDEGPLYQVEPVAATEREEIIAGTIAEMIGDGACLQMGQGGLADTVGRFLTSAGKKDLGIHSELITNSSVALMKAGVVNNSKKALFPGQTVGAIISGNYDLWKAIHKNPDFMVKEISWVNDINNICQNDNVVSINSAICIDLAGQVCAESIGPSQYSGSGGQYNWVVGSQMSRGGKSIIAIPSTYTDKSGTLRSKINVVLPLGSRVTTLMNDVQYVVTEYGAVNLKYRSIDERARALITVAHPDFRDELAFEAKKNGFVL